MSIEEHYKGWRSGFSMIECMVAIVISGLTLVVVGAFAYYSGRSFAAMANYAELNTGSRKALDRLTRDIRQTLSLTTFATNSLTFVGADGQPLTYAYEPATRILTRQKGGNSETILTDCDS